MGRSCQSDSLCLHTLHVLSYKACGAEPGDRVWRWWHVREWSSCVKLGENVFTFVLQDSVQPRTEDAESVLQLRVFKLDQSGVRCGEDRRVSDLLHESPLSAQWWTQQCCHARQEAGRDSTPFTQHCEVKQHCCHDPHGPRNNTTQSVSKGGLLLKAPLWQICNRHVLICV